MLWLMGNRDVQPRSGPDRDLVRPIDPDHGPVSVSVQSFRFGLGLIPLGPIGQTGPDQLDRCSMRFTVNALFKNDIMLHPSTISSMT